MQKNIQKIGFIGQGWIGKNYADNFEDRGYEVVRYSHEDEYIENKDTITKCSVVFIAVPTPTTAHGFDSSILREVLTLLSPGSTAVIKSTLVLGLTRSLQAENQDLFIIHSPEFLSKSTAREDADNPERNILGIPVDDEMYREKAKEVMSLLPNAPYELVCSSEEAEMVKYSHNVSGYFQIMLFNIFYDLATKYNCNWDILKDAFRADSMMSHAYLDPFHKSGRGAGGCCFIKDFAAFRAMYEKAFADDIHAVALLRDMEEKNKELLKASSKDLDYLQGVYGEESSS